MFQRRAVLTRQSYLTLADAGWLAARARGLEPANQVSVAALGATLAAALLEVGEGLEVAAGGPLGVAELEVAHAVLEGGEQCLGRAWRAGLRAVAHQCCGQTTRGQGGSVAQW